MTGSPKDGRNASRPYRVRAGATWYWVDPTVPRDAIEPGDTVVLYPPGGDAVVAVVQGLEPDALTVTNLSGERFEIPSRDVAAMHLAAVDDEQ